MPGSMWLVRSDGWHAASPLTFGLRRGAIQITDVEVVQVDGPGRRWRNLSGYRSRAFRSTDRTRRASELLRAGIRRRSRDCAFNSEHLHVGPLQCGRVVELVALGHFSEAVERHDDRVKRHRLLTLWDHRQSGDWQLDLEIGRFTGAQLRDIHR